MLIIYKVDMHLNSHGNQCKRFLCDTILDIIYIVFRIKILIFILKLNTNNVPEDSFEGSDRQVCRS